MMDTKLLVVDDDPNISELLKIYFEKEGYDVRTACDGVEAGSITSDRVEIKYILHLSCKDVALGQEPLICDIARRPAPQEENGILIYFSQPGEQLWDIAKRYRVSCESLRRMNPVLEGAETTNGERVILWRK